LGRGGGSGGAAALGPRLAAPSSTAHGAPALGVTISWLERLPSKRSLLLDRARGRAGKDG
jgi:hypothetical protein